MFTLKIPLLIRALVYALLVKFSEPIPNAKPAMRNVPGADTCAMNLAKHKHKHKGSLNHKGFGAVPHDERLMQDDFQQLRSTFKPRPAARGFRFPCIRLSRLTCPNALQKS